MGGNLRDGPVSKLQRCDADDDRGGAGQPARPKPSFSHIAPISAAKITDVFTQGRDRGDGRARHRPQHDA